MKKEANLFVILMQMIEAKTQQTLETLGDHVDWPNS